VKWTDYKLSLCFLLVCATGFAHSAADCSHEKRLDRIEGKQ